MLQQNDAYETSAKSSTNVALQSKCVWQVRMSTGGKRIIMVKKCRGMSIVCTFADKNLQYCFGIEGIAQTYTLRLC